MNRIDQILNLITEEISNTAQTLDATDEAQVKKLNFEYSIKNIATAIKKLNEGEQ